MGGSGFLPTSAQIDNDDVTVVQVSDCQRERVGSRTAAKTARINASVIDVHCSTGGNSLRPGTIAESIQTLGRKLSMSSMNVAMYSRSNLCGSNRRSLSSRDCFKLGFIKVLGAFQTKISGESWPKWLRKSSNRMPDF